MIISVASGKGGTGKTTVSTNLAVSLSSEMKVQLLDCDVEEPNAHLFIQPKIVESGSIKVRVPEINEEKCTLCGKCGEICRFKAIVVIGDTVLPFPGMCHSCGGCLAICPDGAITEVDREIGTYERGTRENLEFITGKLNVGEVMSPPLIKFVRSYASPDKLNIIDAPPGTSCPVITAMKKTDFVLLVTEPTPFGLNDLKLAVGAVDLLGIPRGLVVNRSDIGNDDVYAYAKEVSLPILMRIPFDRNIAETYSKGDLLVEKLPHLKERFLKLFRRIEQIIIERGKKA